MMTMSLLDLNGFTIKCTVYYNVGSDGQHVYEVCPGELSEVTATSDESLTVLNYSDSEPVKIQHLL